MSIRYEPKKVIEIPEIEFKRSVQGKYKTMVMNPDGSMEKEGDWHKNLILDCGLDKIAYMPWAQVFQFCVAGDQPSGSVTPAAISDTQLQKPKMMNSFYLPGSGNCGHNIYSSGDNRYLQLFRTFDFLAEKQNAIITELGFKETPGAKKLFSRVVLDGNTAAGRPDPEVLRPGQYLRVKYELNVQLDPVNPNISGLIPTGSDGNLPTISWSGSAASGDRHGLQHIGMIGINHSGVADPVDAGGACNEPFAVGAVDFGPGFGYVNRWQNGENVFQETNASGTILGYKQPTGAERLSDRPGPLLTLTDYQDVNRFINHDAITGSGVLGVNVHKNMSGIAGATTTSNTISGASGYWPWGNYLHFQQLQDFATAYGTSSYSSNFTSASTASYGHNLLRFMGTSTETYANNYQTPFFTYGPLSFVMRPVSRYGVENSQVNWPVFAAHDSSNSSNNYFEDGVPSSDPSSRQYNPNYALYLTEMSVGATTTSQDNPSKRAQYFNVDHFYQPDQNSTAGSYLTFDETVTLKGFDNANQSAKWDAWDLRGASCFLSTSTDPVQAFGATGVAYDRSSGVNYYELPLRKAEYNEAQSGDSRTLTKFCFYDNAVGNSIENGTRIHDAWATVGVGATTDTSINPITMSGAARDNGYVYRLATPRDKDNDHILKVSFKYTWTRNTGQL